MSIIKKILLWILIIFFFLYAIGALAEMNFITAIIAIVIGLILIPKFTQIKLIGQEIKFTPLIKTVIVIVGFIILVMVTDQQQVNQPINNQQVTQTPQIATSTEATTSIANKIASEKANFKAQLKTMVNSLKKYNAADYKQYKNELGSLRSETDLFSSWAVMVNMAKLSDDPMVKNLGKTLQKEASQIQMYEFPLLRKAYAEMANKEMWINNMKIRAYGTSYKTIDFIAADFADNKNISDAHQSSIGVLEMLRFNRANYKWIDNSYAEYTYFDLNSSKDSEVIPIIIK